MKALYLQTRSIDTSEKFGMGSHIFYSSTEILQHPPTIISVLSLRLRTLVPSSSLCNERKATVCNIAREDAPRRKGFMRWGKRGLTDGGKKRI